MSTIILEMSLSLNLGTLTPDASLRNT